jgi:ATP-dependent protease HslVU (ClpYQ) peptidase subunit
VALKDGLITHLKVEESTGTRADSHGSNDFTQAAFSPPDSATGKIGNAANYVPGSGFAGANPGLLSTSAEFDTGDVPLTWACWVRFNSLGAAQELISKRTGAAVDAFLQLDSGGNLRFVSGHWNGSDFDQVLSSVEIEIDTWYYVAASHDPDANELRIYVNGTVDTESFAHGLTNSVGTVALGLFEVANSTPLDGLLDEVSFWNVVKSETDLNTIYNAGDGLDFDEWDAGSEEAEGFADLVAEALLEAVGSRPSEGAADLVAEASLEAAGGRASEGAAELVAEASLEAAGERASEGAADLTAEASLEAAGDAPPDPDAAEGSADLSAVATLEASGARTSAGSADLSAIADLDAVGETPSIFESIQEELRAELGADATLAGDVSDRIYPGEVPDDDAPKPWLYYSVTESTPLDQLDGGDLDVRSEVEFHALAGTYGQAKSILDRVYTIVEGFHGDIVRRALWSASSEEFTEEGYHHVVRFAVWWSRPFPEVLIVGPEGVTSIQEDIRAALGTDSTLTDLVGESIYPGEVPDDDAPTPWVYYSVPDSEPIDQLDPGPHLVVSDVEFHALAETYAQAKTIADRLTDVLNAYRGQVVRRALWSGTAEEVTEEGYHHLARFRVWWMSNG